MVSEPNKRGLISVVWVCSGTAHPVGASPFARAGNIVCRPSKGGSSPPSTIDFPNRLNRSAPSIFLGRLLYAVPSLIPFGSVWRYL